MLGFSDGPAMLAQERAIRSTQQWALGVRCGRRAGTTGFRARGIASFRQWTLAQEIVRFRRGSGACPPRVHSPSIGLPSPRSSLSIATSPQSAGHGYVVYIKTMSPRGPCVTTSAKAESVRVGQELHLRLRRGAHGQVARGHDQVLGRRAVVGLEGLLPAGEHPLGEDRRERRVDRHLAGDAGLRACRL
jgi:hypothetical protein